MQTTHSKRAADRVAHNEDSVIHNEGAKDNNSDERNEWDEVLANQWQQHQYEGFSWRRERDGKQPMSYDAWSQPKTRLDAELELKRLWMAQREK